MLPYWPKLEVVLLPSKKKKRIKQPLLICHTPSVNCALGRKFHRNKESEANAIIKLYTTPQLLNSGLKKCIHKFTAKREAEEY